MSEWKTMDTAPTDGSVFRARSSTGAEYNCLYSETDGYFMTENMQWSVDPHRWSQANSGPEGNGNG